MGRRPNPKLKREIVEKLKYTWDDLLIVLASESLKGAKSPDSRDGLKIFTNLKSKYQHKICADKKVKEGVDKICGNIWNEHRNAR